MVTSDGDDGAASRVALGPTQMPSELDVADLAPTWHEQLATWLDQVVQAGLAEPNAMVLATADPAGRPSSRTVLAKLIDARGVAFFTNFTSRKMHELEVSRVASATFPWFALRRQVHVRGRIEPVSDTEADRYWATRPRGSQLGAWASPQSNVVRDRRALDAAMDQVSRRFADTTEVPRPPHWGGLRIRPETVEFWQGRPNRVHDRLCFVLRDGVWSIQRLAP